MSFIADTFVFDGIPCENYGLRLFSFDTAGKEESESGSKISIVEDRTTKSIRPIHYGTVQKDALQFSMTFGSELYLDKYDVDLIVSWLTECNGYKNLDICQADMEYTRYRCIITDLKNIYINEMPVAFKCTVVCDSPYAYTPLITYKKSIISASDMTVQNRSNIIGGCNPMVTLSPSVNTQSISIINLSDNNKETLFTNLPNAENLKIIVDCERKIITSNTNINIYECFNDSFLKLVRGTNKLRITGSCELEITAEYPMKVGG